MASTGHGQEPSGFGVGQKGLVLVSGGSMDDGEDFPRFHAKRKEMELFFQKVSWLVGWLVFGAS